MSCFVIHSWNLNTNELENFIGLLLLSVLYKSVTSIQKVFTMLQQGGDFKTHYVFRKMKYSVESSLISRPKNRAKMTGTGKFMVIREL